MPVDIPEDPKGVLKSDSSAALLFQQPGIFVVRQLEMLNLFIGYEQANRYRILDTHGATLGYLLEQDMGFMNNVARQVFKTHRGMFVYMLSENYKLKYLGSIPMYNNGN